MLHYEIKSKPHEDVSILVSADNHRGKYLAEAGYASRLTVKDCLDLQAIFISHTHIDHFINFDNIIRHQLGQERTVVVCGPRGLAKQLRAKLKSYNWNLLQTKDVCYEVREFDGAMCRRFLISSPKWTIEALSDLPGDVLYRTKAFAVTGVLLDHHTDSMAYLFREESKISIDLDDSNFSPGQWIRELKNAYDSEEDDQVILVGERSYQAKDLYYLLSNIGGDSLGIIMDHGATESNHEAIVNHFDHCNRVVIECFFADEEEASAKQHMHSFASASGRVMNRAKVKSAEPIHFSRKYDRDGIDKIKRQFRSAFELGA